MNCLSFFAQNSIIKSTCNNTVQCTCKSQAYRAFETSHVQLIGVTIGIKIAEEAWKGFQQVQM